MTPANNPPRKALLISNLPLTSVAGIERLCFYLKHTLEEHHIVVDTFSLADIPATAAFRLSTRILPVLREYYWPYRHLRNRLRRYDLVITNNYTGGAVDTRRHHVVNFTHGLYRAGIERLARTDPGARFPHSRQLRAAEFLSKRKNTPQTIFTVSGRVHDELRTLYGIDSTILLNAVDTDHFRKQDTERKRLRRQFRIRPTDLVGIYAGRWNYFEKKLQYLVELIQRRQDITWLLVTDQRPDVHGLANVRCLQNVGYQGMPGVYSMADFAIQLSIYEGCSYFSLESISCSLPLISTRVGGTREIYDNPAIRRLLVPVWHDDPGFLAEVNSRLSLLRDNAELRRTIAGQARKTAETRFSLPRWRQELCRHLGVGNTTS